MDPVAALSVLDALLNMASRRFSVPVASLEPDGDLFASLGIDSVTALDLLTELEERFDVDIPDYELRLVTTFRQLAALVERRR